jgi:hypothetical protein
MNHRGKTAKNDKGLDSEVSDSTLNTVQESEGGFQHCRARVYSPGMRPILLALAVAVIGCDNGPQWPEVFPYEYQTGCFLVLSEVELDQARLDFNAGLMTSLVEPLIGDPCVYRAAVVHVMATQAWGPENTVGHYSLFSGITVGWMLKGWAHEILHARDASNFAVGTGWHENWNTNGYETAFREYARQSRDVRAYRD